MIEKAACLIKFSDHSNLSPWFAHTLFPLVELKLKYLGYFRNGLRTKRGALYVAGAYRS